MSARPGQDAAACAAFCAPAHRLTKQREQVIRALSNARRYVTAQEVHHRLRRVGQIIGLATVYRTLEALREMGWAATARIDGHTAYVLCRSEHHHHAVCKRCGRVDDVPCPNLRQYEKVLSQGLRFRLTGHQVEFYGLCAHCS